jgi:hypothetical protein
MLAADGDAREKSLGAGAIGDILRRLRPIRAHHNHGGADRSTPAPSSARSYLKQRMAPVRACLGVLVSGSAVGSSFDCPPEVLGLGDGF